MANYTITRHIESGHTYGCTNFSTFQTEGDVASEIAGAPLDSTIEWNLKAKPGFSVDIMDYKFSNATLGGGIYTSIPNATGNTTRWTGLLSPILTAIMEQKSSSLIRITLYLKDPSGGSMGAPFVMPDNDVSIAVLIEGCARQSASGVHLRLGKPLDQYTITRAVVMENLEKSVVSNFVSDTRDEVNGIMPPLALESIGVGDRHVMSYFVSAETGFRYSSPPALSFASDEYYVESFIIYAADEAADSFKKTKTKTKDITGARFEIYKKN